MCLFNCLIASKMYNNSSHNPDNNSDMSLEISIFKTNYEKIMREINSY